MDPRNGNTVKTLGIKLPDALHAQFALIASLDEISLGDAAVRAVEHYVQTKRAEPDFAERAKRALADIEREAAARAGAIQGLFGGEEITPQSKPAPTTRGRKAAGTEG